MTTRTRLTITFLSFSAIVLWVSMAQAAAATLKEQCPDLATCIETASKLTGKKYFYSAPLDGKILSTSNLEMTKRNADQLISRILNLNGWTRIPFKDNSFTVIASREIRFSPTSAIKTTRHSPPKLPDNDDYYMINYKMLDGEMANDIARQLRPFLSQFGRIVTSKNTGQVIIQDTANNLKRLYQIVKENDVISKRTTKKEVKRKKKRMTAKKIKNT